MIKKIVKEISSFYNKKVVFNTDLDLLNPKVYGSKAITKDTQNFLIEEDVIGNTRYIMTARINEHEDYVEVVKIGFIVKENKTF